MNEVTHYRLQPSKPMEREDTAWEEPFTRDPDLSHTAQNSGTTSLRDSSSLYIEPDDLLAIKPTKAQASSSTPGFESPKEDQSEERPTKRRRLAPPLVHHTSRPLAPVTMSRHSSAVTSKGVQQYQLMSSETPADQARSLSQVSPGFIFVISPMSKRCFLCPALLFPALFLFLPLAY